MARHQFKASTVGCLVEKNSTIARFCKLTGKGFLSLFRNILAHSTEQTNKGCNCKVGKTSENLDFAHTIGNYLFLQLSAASWVIRYLTTCKGLVKKRFMGAFLCLKEQPPTTKKSFLSIYHLEHINSRSVLIVAAGNSIMC